MLVHNWTTAPPAHPHTETPLWIYQILSSELVTELHENTLHNKSVRAALVVKDGTGRQKTLREGRRGRGSYIACKKPSTSVHECTFIQDNSRVPSEEKTQLSSKHQRIPVMMKTHNISANSIPHCCNFKNKKLKQNKTKKHHFCTKAYVHPLSTPSKKIRMYRQIKVFKMTVHISFAIHISSATRSAPTLKSGWINKTIVLRCVKGQRMSEGDLRGTLVTKEDSSEQQVFGDPWWGKFGNASLIRQIWQSTWEETVVLVGTAEQSDSPKGPYKVPRFKFSEKSDRNPPVFPLLSPEAFPERRKDFSAAAELSIMTVLN